MIETKTECLFNLHWIDAGSDVLTQGGITQAVLFQVKKWLRLRHAKTKHVQHPTSWRIINLDHFELGLVYILTCVDHLVKQGAVSNRNLF